MKIEILKISELITFVESEKFQQLHNIPITPFRAISQQNNPRAENDQIALLCAYNDENELVAYAGALPDFLYGDENEKVAWSSGWWSHPEKGRKFALPVFLKLLEFYDNKMLFSHLTLTTKGILEKLQIADIHTVTGLKCYLRLDTQKAIGHKKNWVRNLKVLTEIFDFSFNIVNAIRLSWFNLKLSKELKFNSINSFDEELKVFIKKNNSNNIVKRNIDQFEWIKNYPWLYISNKEDNISRRYYFSSHSVQFYNEFYKVMKENRIVGFIHIQVREGEMRIPYIYFENQYAKDILSFIYDYAITNNIKFLLSFNQEFCRIINENKSPFFYKRKTERYFGSTKQLNIQNMQIQDGDGDVVFT